jgi:hypothetical protein
MNRKLFSGFENIFESWRLVKSRPSSTRPVVPKVGDIAPLGAMARFWGTVRKKRAVGGRQGAGSLKSKSEVRTFVWRFVRNTCSTGLPAMVLHPDRFFNLSWVYVSDKLKAGLAAGLTASFQIQCSRNISQASEFNSMKLGTRHH